MASSRPLVGVDIGTSGIRGAQVKRHRDGSLEVIRAASVDLPRGAVRNGAVQDPRTVAKALRRLWRQGHFTTKRVAFGLADSGVLTRQLELPWMPPDDFRSALRYQVGDALPVDIATVELDYHLLDRLDGTDERGTPTAVNRILVVASDRDAVTAEAQTLRKAGLEPVIADSTAMALIRVACQGRLPESGETSAIADVGADQLTVVVHEKGQPRFVRTVANLGGEAATEAVAEALDMDLDDAEAAKQAIGLNGPAPIVAPIAESSVFSDSLAAEEVPADPRTSAIIAILNPWATTVVSEIRNSLDYYQAAPASSTIASLTLVGRTITLSGMVERVATQFPLPVRALPPLAGLAANRRVTRHLPADARLAAALGLAMAVSP